MPCDFSHKMSFKMTINCYPIDFQKGDILYFLTNQKVGICSMSFRTLSSNDPFNCNISNTSILQSLMVGCFPMTYRIFSSEITWLSLNVPKKVLTETRMNKYHGSSKLGWSMFICVKVIPDISGLVVNPR